MTGHDSNGLRGAVLAAAIALGGLLAVPSANAAPLAAAPAEAIAGETGATAVQWHHRHHHWGRHRHHHRGWGHRGHHWGHHHHHGYGHHHHHRRGRHFY